MRKDAIRPPVYVVGVTEATVGSVLREVSSAYPDARWASGAELVDGYPDFTCGYLRIDFPVGGPPVATCSFWSTPYTHPADATIVPADDCHPLPPAGAVRRS
jgi:hypothetical protein